MFSKKRDYNKNPRSYADNDQKEYSDASAYRDDTPSLTKQSEAEACDINVIMKKYSQTGYLPMAEREALYGDFSDQASFQEAMGIIAQANAQFSSLPAKVRARFANDPGRFLAFCEDEKNLPEMIELGLATKREPPAEDPNLTALKAIEANTRARKTKHGKDSGALSASDDTE